MLEPSLELSALNLPSTLTGHKTMLSALISLGATFRVRETLGEGLYGPRKGWAMFLEVSTSDQDIQNGPCHSIHTLSPYCGSY